MLVLMGVSFSLCVANTAYADTIYSTGFENPPFVVGIPLVGQDGWSVGGTPDGPLSPNAAVISKAKPRQGKQSVLVLGDDLVHQDFINFITGGYYDAIGSYRKTVDYDTGGTQTVRISAHVRVNGKRTDTGNNFFSASIVARGANVASTTPSGTVGIGELTISSDGHVYGYSGDDDVPVFLAKAPVSLGEWHNLAVDVNFTNSTFSFFVDDDCLGSFPFPSLPGNFLRRGSLIAYAAPDTTELKKANYSAFYDQFRIKVVDESEGCKAK
jgi:hypothetical protein